MSDTQAKLEKSLIGNYDPSIIEEVTGRMDPTMTNFKNFQKDIKGGPSAGVVQFAEGTKDSPINNLTLYMNKSKYSKAFKDEEGNLPDPFTPQGRDRIQSTLNSLKKKVGKSALIEDQINVSKELESVKRANSVAKKTMPLEAIPEEIFGYIHGLGVNMGTRAAHDAIITPALSQFKAGEIDEQGTIKVMAVSRSVINGMISPMNLLERNITEPLRHSGKLSKYQDLTMKQALNSKDPEVAELAKSVKAAGELGRKYKKLMRNPETMDQVPKQYREVYFERVPKAKKAYEKMREAQTNAVYRAVESKLRRV